MKSRICLLAYLVCFMCIAVQAQHRGSHRYTQSGDRNTEGDGRPKLEEGNFRHRTESSRSLHPTRDSPASSSQRQHKVTAEDFERSFNTDQNSKRFTARPKPETNERLSRQSNTNLKNPRLSDKNSEIINNNANQDSSVRRNSQFRSRDGNENLQKDILQVSQEVSKNIPPKRNSRIINFENEGNKDPTVKHSRNHNVGRQNNENRETNVGKLEGIDSIETVTNRFNRRNYQIPSRKTEGLEAVQSQNKEISHPSKDFTKESAQHNRHSLRRISGFNRQNDQTSDNTDQNISAPNREKETINSRRSHSSKENRNRDNTNVQSRSENYRTNIEHEAHPKSREQINVQDTLSNPESLVPTYRSRNNNDVNSKESSHEHINDAQTLSRRTPRIQNENIHKHNPTTKPTLDTVSDIQISLNNDNTQSTENRQISLDQNDSKKPIQVSFLRRNRDKGENLSLRNRKTSDDVDPLQTRKNKEHETLNEEQVHAESIQNDVARKRFDDGNHRYKETNGIKNLYQSKTNHNSDDSHETQASPTKPRNFKSRDRDNNNAASSQPISSRQSNKDRDKNNAEEIKNENIPSSIFQSKFRDRQNNHPRRRSFTRENTVTEKLNPSRVSVPNVPGNERLTQSYRKQKLTEDGTKTRNNKENVEENNDGSLITQSERTPNNDKISQRNNKLNLRNNFRTTKLLTTAETIIAQDNLKDLLPVNDNVQNKVNDAQLLSSRARLKEQKSHINDDNNSDKLLSTAETITGRFSSRSQQNVQETEVDKKLVEDEKLKLIKPIQNEKESPLKRKQNFRKNIFSSKGANQESREIKSAPQDSLPIRSDTRGSVTYKKTPADEEKSERLAKKSGKSETGDDEGIDEEDNYPVEYKQLRKAGNGPKEILELLKARKAQREAAQRSSEQRNDQQSIRASLLAARPQLYQQVTQSDNSADEVTRKPIAKPDNRFEKNAKQNDDITERSHNVEPTNTRENLQEQKQILLQSRSENDSSRNSVPPRGRSFNRKRLNESPETKRTDITHADSTERSTVDEEKTLDEIKSKRTYTRRDEQNKPIREFKIKPTVEVETERSRFVPSSRRNGIVSKDDSIETDSENDEVRVPGKLKYHLYESSSRKKLVNQQLKPESTTKLNVVEDVRTVTRSYSKLARYPKLPTTINQLPSTTESSLVARLNARRFRQNQATTVDIPETLPPVTIIYASSLPTAKPLESDSLVLELSTNSSTATPTTLTPVPSSTTNGTNAWATDVALPETTANSETPTSTTFSTTASAINDLSSDEPLIITLSPMNDLTDFTTILNTSPQPTITSTTAKLTDKPETLFTTTDRDLINEIQTSTQAVKVTSQQTTHKPDFSTEAKPSSGKPLLSKITKKPIETNEILNSQEIKQLENKNNLLSILTTTISLPVISTTVRPPILLSTTTIKSIPKLQTSSPINVISSTPKKGLMPKKPQSTKKTSKITPMVTTQKTTVKVVTTPVINLINSTPLGSITITTPKPSTTEAPVTTPKQPTTEAPVTTPKQPATKAPVTPKQPTTKASVTTPKQSTTKAPVTTPKQPTTKIPIQPTKKSVLTQKPPPKTTTKRPPNTTKKGPSKGEKGKPLQTTTVKQMIPPIPVITKPTNTSLLTTTEKLTSKQTVVTKSPITTSATTKITITEKPETKKSSKKVNTQTKNIKQTAIAQDRVDDALDPELEESSHDFVVYGLLPNKSLVRRVPSPTPRTELPFVVYGLYPNGTIVRRFPNGTIIPDDPQETNELVADTVDPSDKSAISELLQRDQPPTRIPVTNAPITTQTSTMSTTMFSTTQTEATPVQKSIATEESSQTSTTITSTTLPTTTTTMSTTTITTTNTPSSTLPTTILTTTKKSPPPTTTTKKIPPTTTKKPSPPTTTTTKKPSPPTTTTKKPPPPPTTTTKKPQTTTTKKPKPKPVTTTRKPNTNTVKPKPKPASGKSSATKKPKQQPQTTSTTSTTTTTTPRSTTPAAVQSATRIAEDFALLNTLLLKQLPEENINANSIQPELMSSTPAMDSDDLANRIIQLAIERAGPSSTPPTPASAIITLAGTQPSSLQDLTANSNTFPSLTSTNSPDNTVASSKPGGKISVWVVPEAEMNSVSKEKTTQTVPKLTPQEEQVLNALLSSPSPTPDQLLLAELLSGNPAAAAMTSTTSTTTPSSTTTKKRKKTKTTAAPTTTQRTLLPTLGIFSSQRQRGGGFLRSLGSNTNIDDDEESSETASDTQAPQRPLISAALNMSRAVSQFMGLVIQDAVHQLQAYLEERLNGVLGVADKNNTVTVS